MAKGNEETGNLKYLNPAPCQNTSDFILRTMQTNKLVVESFHTYWGKLTPFNLQYGEEVAEKLHQKARS